MLNLDELKKEERLSVWGRYPVVDDIFQVELQDLKENYYKYYDDICMMFGGVFDNKTFMFFEADVNPLFFENDDSKIFEYAEAGGELPIRDTALSCINILEADPLFRDCPIMFGGHDVEYGEDDSEFSLNRFTIFEGKIYVGVSYARRDEIAKLFKHFQSVIDEHLVKAFRKNSME